MLRNLLSSQVAARARLVNLAHRAASSGSAQPQRFGRVIQLKDEHIEEYMRTHSDANPGVRDLLVKHNLRNFSIFKQRMPDTGKTLLFLYCEYTGRDYKQDMAALSAEPRNIAWLQQHDAMQQCVIPGRAGWTDMTPVFRNE